LLMLLKTNAVGFWVKDCMHPPLSFGSESYVKCGKSVNNGARVVSCLQRHDKCCRLLFWPISMWTSGHPGGLIYKKKVGNKSCEHKYVSFSTIKTKRNYKLHMSLSQDSKNLQNCPSLPLNTLQICS
jgi:hypothetical protein